MSRRLVHLDQLQTHAGQRTTIAPRYLSVYLSTHMQMPNRDHIHLFRKWKRIPVSEFSHTAFIYYYIVSAAFLMSQETRNTKIIKVLSMGSQQL